MKLKSRNKDERKIKVETKQMNHQNNENTNTIRHQYKI